MDIDTGRSTEEWRGKPGTHALIVGVSDYPYLRGGRTVPEGLRFTSLSSPAKSAVAVQRWLVDAYSRPEAPLATCRLLISPSDPECADPEILESRELCTVDEFVAAASAWRDDAASHPENITFFYFAGHAFELSKGELIVLLADFGRGVGPLLRGAVSVNNLFLGMAPNRRQPDIARTQLFFLDTSRQRPLEVQQYEMQNTTPVFDVDLRTIDDRRAVMFYATSPGGAAYAQTNGRTFFSEALLRCLNGEAGLPAQTDAQGKWIRPRVSITSLAQGMGNVLREMGEEVGVQQDIVVSGLVRDAVIHYLDHAPSVAVTIAVSPPAAVPLTGVEVRDLEGGLVLATPGPLQQSPYQIDLPAGLYSFNFQVDPPHPEFSNRTIIRNVAPPRFSFIVSMTRQ